MFSKSVEYALRAVAHLAYEAPNGRTTEQIAAATRVESATYLSKVLQALRSKGVVKSQRGIGGGITLAKPGRESDHSGSGQRRRTDSANQIVPARLEESRRATVPTAPPSGRRDGNGRGGVQEHDARGSAGGTDAQSAIVRSGGGAAAIEPTDLQRDSRPIASRM